MERPQNLAVELKCIANLMRRMVEHHPDRNQFLNLTSMQIWVMEYLYINQDKEIFQRDLETEFQVRRSTITGILQGMEKKNLIRREPVERDARLKQLIPTQEALDLFKDCLKEVDEFEAVMLKGVTQEELDLFLTVIEKIKSNLEGNIT